MVRCLLTRMFVLMALAGAMIAGSAHGQAPAHRERMVQRVYSVADLVVPIDAVKAGMGAAPCVPAPPVVNRWVGPGGLERVGVNFSEPQCQPKPVAGCCAKSGPATPATCEGQLIKLLQTTVAPKTWTNAGGAGSIEYNPTSMALVVHQTPAIQDQVDELLSSLRQLQDVQVAMNIQIVSIGDSMFEHMAQEFDLNLQPSKLLDGDTVAKILDAFQGDRRTCVLQAPKVTTFNGQEARVVCGDERFFITGMKAQRHNGQLVLMPQNERFTTGSNITVQPTVTPDNRNVVVKFHAEVSEMPDATVPLFPVTTFVTPVFEGGAQGQPIPFTQFIQQPTVVTRGVTKVFGIPDGKTGFIYGGRCSHTVKHVNRVPVLGDLPLLGDLFTSESQSVESNHLVFLVTPKVVLTGDEDKRAVVGPPCEGKIPFVAMMPTQAPRDVLDAANSCSYGEKQQFNVVLSKALCPQCPNSTCPAENCPEACCPVPQATCPLCTNACTKEKCPPACCTATATPCPLCTKPCAAEKCPPACCAVAPTVCPPCIPSFPVSSATVYLVNPVVASTQPCEVPANSSAPQPVRYFIVTEAVNEGKQLYSLWLSPESCHQVLPAGPPQVLQTSVELAPVPTPVVEAQPANEPLRKLLAKYQRACAEGRTKDAKKLAGKCLAIDPKCFARDE